MFFSFSVIKIFFILSYIHRVRINLKFKIKEDVGICFPFDKSALLSVLHSLYCMIIM